MRVLQQALDSGIVGKMLVSEGEKAIEGAYYMRYTSAAPPDA